MLIFDLLGATRRTLAGEWSLFISGLKQLFSLERAQKRNNDLLL